MIRTGLIGFIALLSLTACEKSGFSYDNTVDGGNVQYTLLDTLTIRMRTVKIDSVLTSGTGVALAGVYTDPYFGKIQAHSYFRAGLPANRIPEDRAVYDSIELIIKPNGYYYGDTLSPQRLQLYQLSRKLALPDNYTAFYNHQYFPVISDPIADQPVWIKPHAGDWLHLRINDTKGKELFDLLKNRAQEVSGDDLFQEYFKGLSIRGNSNSAVFGFEAKDSTLYIRLHYHISTHEIEEKYFDFQLSAPELQFNAVTSDRTGTPLEKLPSGYTGLPSTAIDNRGFLQALTGVATRLDFPGLSSLLELGRYGRVIKAELVLRPITGSYRDYGMPAKLALGLADGKNQVAAGDTLASSATGIQYGNLQIDWLNPENTRYSYDVTDYCKAMITTDVYNYRGLMLMPTRGDYHTQLNRLVIGDGKNSTHRAQLRIYYLLYQ